jgi:hypothetical protein
MADMTGGEVFVDGQTVNGSRLNNHVNNAVLVPDCINGRGAITPTGADYLLIYRATPSPILRKATVTSINAVSGNVTSVSLTLPATEFNVSGGGSGAVALAGTWKPSGGNTVLASPGDGTFGVPSFRRMVPADIGFGTTQILSAAIDWAGPSNRFAKAISVITTFSFSHIVDGLSIRVAITYLNPAAVAHWPSSGPTAVRWPGGIEPTSTAGTNIFDFSVIGGVVYGWLAAANCHA